MKVAFLLTLLAALGMYSWKFLFDRSKKGNRLWLILTIAGLLHIVIMFFSFTYVKVKGPIYSADEWHLVEYIFIIGIIDFLLMLVIGLIWHFASKRNREKAEQPHRKSPIFFTIGTPILYLSIVVLLFLFKVVGGIYSNSYQLSDEGMVIENTDKEKIIEWSTYQHSTRDFTISVPSNAKLKENAFPVVDLRIDLEQGVKILISFDYRDSDFNLDKNMNDCVNDITENDLDGAKSVIETGKVQINDVTFSYVRHKFEMEGILNSIMESYVGDLDTTIVYIVTDSDKEPFESVKPILDKIIYSFKVGEPR